MWTIFLKSLLNLLQYCFFFLMFWFFGSEARGILAPRPGIEPAPPVLEGEVLTTGRPGKSLTHLFSSCNLAPSSLSREDAQTGFVKLKCKQMMQMAQRSSDTCPRACWGHPRVTARRARHPIKTSVRPSALKGSRGKTTPASLRIPLVPEMTHKNKLIRTSCIKK